MEVLVEVEEGREKEVEEEGGTATTGAVEGRFASEARSGPMSRVRLSVF